MNNFKTAIPAMTVIANAVSKKIANLNKDLIALYQEGTRTDGYVNPEIFSYYDCDLKLINMIDSISDAEYNEKMAPEMAKAIEILQSVKAKNNEQENINKNKKNKIIQKIGKLHNKARIDFGTVIDFDNLLYVKMNIKRLDEEQRQSLIEVMSENGFEVIDCRDSVSQMLFAGVVEDQEKIPTLHHFIFNLLDGKVTSDRNFVGCIICEPMSESRLISVLSD